MNPASSSRRLAAVWFADLVGYTALSSRDERAALRLVGMFQEAVKQHVARYGGRLVKFIGDAALAEFTSTEAAVRAALAVRQLLAQPSPQMTGGVQLRVGVHVGDVLSTPDGDIYGDGVNIASRLQNQADPGQVLVSEDVWRQLRPRAQYRFDSLGERELKGIPMRMAVFGVDAADAGSLESADPAWAGVPPREQALPPIARQPGARHRRIAVAAVAVAVIALAALAYRFGPSMAGPSASFELDRLTEVTSEGIASLAAIAPDGRHIAHVKNPAGRPSLWVRQRDTISDIQVVGPAHDRFDGLTFSRDGSHIYYVVYSADRQMGTLFRVAALGGTPMRLVDDIDTAVGVSPDGQRLAFVRGEPAAGKTHLVIANADGSDVRARLTVGPEKNLAFVAPSWSSDAARLLVVVTEGVGREAVYSLELSSGSLTRAGEPFAQIRSVHWLPGNRSFVVSAATSLGGNTQIWRIALPSGERQRVTNDLNSYTSVSVAADAASLIAVQSESRSSLWIVSRDGASRPLLESRRDDGVFGLAWAANGQIVFQSNRLGSRQIWTIGADGSNLRQLTEGPDTGFPAVSHDGRWIVYARTNDESVEVWRTSFDGAGTPARLVSTGGFPTVCNDGWVYYPAVDKSIFAAETHRVRLDGGVAEDVGDQIFTVADCLPNGDLLGYTWNDAAKRTSVAVLSKARGLRLFERIPSDGHVKQLKVTPDGQGISLLHRAGRRVEVWMTTFEQTPPVQLTQSGTEDVFAYDWSPDGRHLVVSRGRVENDVVLLHRKQ